MMTLTLIIFLSKGSVWMNVVEFVFLDKQNVNEYLHALFKILYSNMSPIAPTNNSYDEDYEVWSSFFISATQKEKREIVLMFVDDTLAGYFQYYVNIDTNTLMMEEMQIKKAFQGTGLFSQFYKWLIKHLPDDIESIEAYVNKKNYKAQFVLTYLGLIRAGENENRNSFYYRGKYLNLPNKYN